MGFLLVGVPIITIVVALWCWGIMCGLLRWQSHSAFHRNFRKANHKEANWRDCSMCARQYYTEDYC